RPDRLEQLRRRRDASDVVGVPDGVAEPVEEQLGSVTLERLVEPRRETIAQDDLLEAGMGMEVRKDPPAARLQPIRDRNGEPALLRPRLLLRLAIGDPPPKEVLLMLPGDLQVIRQAEREPQELTIEERHPAFYAMDHQTPVHLGHEVVREPIADVPGLEGLKAREATGIEPLLAGTVAPIRDR